MSLSMALLTRMLSLSKNHGIRESGPSRTNVNRSSTGKIQAGKFVEPAIGVPGPACDWAVHDCGPEETEDERWDDTAAFEAAPNDNLNRAGAEEELVKAEYNLWNV
jgi:hypothetical protein